MRFASVLAADPRDVEPIDVTFPADFSSSLETVLWNGWVVVIASPGWIAQSTQRDV